MGSNLCGILRQGADAMQRLKILGTLLVFLFGMPLISQTLRAHDHSDDYWHEHWWDTWDWDVHGTKLRKTTIVDPNVIGRWSLVVYKKAELTHNDPSLVPNLPYGILTIYGTGDFEWSKREGITVGKVSRMIPPRDANPEARYWKVSFNKQPYFVFVDPSSPNMLFMCNSGGAPWVATGKHLDTQEAPVVEVITK
jgi:hypothetical protein